jgi:hypothetical protein
LQTYKTYVSSISDTSVIFNNVVSGSPDKVYEIMSKDITGFRKMIKIQPYLKPILSLGLPISAYFILANNTSLSTGGLTLWSTILSIAIKISLDLILPENIKIHITNGWRIQFGVISNN